MGAEHPIAWYHAFDGAGLSTWLGHTAESYSDSLFLGHLLGGLRYAMGENVEIDFAKSHTPIRPIPPCL